MPVRPIRLASDPAGRWGATMSAPVFFGTTLEGFVVVQRRAGAADFTARDLELLSALAGHVGNALPQARARFEQGMRTFMRQDLVAAGEVQRTFLPRLATHNSAWVRLVAEYLPALAVGGDFYDFVDLGGGRVLAAIGDVSGKGVNAALVMARLSSELRRLASETSSPSELLSLLNRSLAARLQDDRFATVLCALLDLPARRWVVANAGHPAPLLRRRDGTVTRLTEVSGPPIGIEATLKYGEQVYPAAPEDILLLVTDGAVEVVDGARPEHHPGAGPCRVTELLARGPHDIDHIAATIVGGAEAVSERDDVALLALQLPGASAFPDRNEDG